MKNPEDDNSPNKALIKSKNKFPVAGIGASAGGLTAFKQLIQSIPADSGMAYVLVQHLDPNHDSLLPDQQEVFWRQDNGKVTNRRGKS